MIRFLYIASSSYSGSTLLSFLLNAHPDIFTVGEMDGWNYAPNTVFPCSCGAPLSECEFFRRIAAAFRREGLPFDPREFGTRYTLARSPRWNRYLTAELPRIGSTVLETARDQLVAHVPGFARLLARQDRANLVFVQTALAASGATVFLDACKSPYRLRHLRRIRELDIHVLYLVRDPRGVSLSNMKKKGYGAALAIRLWINEQMAICRIAEEFPKRITVVYEDLCEAVDSVLTAIHKFVGLAPTPAPPDFRSVPHHILGNDMRLTTTSTITKDARWARELVEEDLCVIAQACATFRRCYPNHPVSGVIGRYGCDVVNRLPPTPANPAREMPPRTQASG